MAGEEIQELVERLVRGNAGTAHRTATDETWLRVAPEGVRLPQHGWKLHVSSRAATLADLVGTLVPVLLAEGCTFKLAKSVGVLERLNDGIHSPATVGKAFTIYPDAERVRDLGLQLAELLAGHEGPRVLSDRRVRPGSPVYYRYGPFTKPWTTDAYGRLIAYIEGPGGEEFGALATLRYRQPEWVEDPFTGERGRAHDTQGESSDADVPAREPRVIGGHYEITAGVYESGRGDTYRALDRRNGRRVVVKQARALVDERGSGDVRMRLRNERRVLQALDGVADVAGFVDHFRYGADEYLVTEDVGPANLDDDVMLRGRYGFEDGAERSLAALGSRLARILLAVHERGVIVRDLSPKNVIVDGDRISLIDFGLSYYDGLHLPGATIGYSPARQLRGEDPRPADDFAALGMTLAFAAYALAPVSVGEDWEAPRERVLQTLRRDFGAEPSGIIGVIADLLDADEDVVLRAARRLASGSISDEASVRLPRLSLATLPALPEVTDALAAEIAGNLLGDLLDQTRRVLKSSSGQSVAHDAGVYSGAAGIGLELLEHLDAPGVADVLADLVPFTVRAVESVDLSPGLMVGRTGVDVFLARAAAAGFRDSAHRGASIPADDWTPTLDDLIVGASGVALGHLLLEEFEPDRGHLAAARRSAQFVLGSPLPTAESVPTNLPETAGVDPSIGRAHGLAGTVEMLHVVGHRLADQALLDAAEERAKVLRTRAGEMIPRAVTPFAAPLAVSWCQGLAGVAQTLHLVGAQSEAHSVADACVASLPRVSVATQCCGGAGIGNMLIDLGRWDDARAVAVHMLLRSEGPARHPVFIKDEPHNNSASWAFGVAGLLAFFRRLARGGGHSGLPVPEAALVNGR
ncbi:MAG: serine/threonine protein kinase [Catenulispora sp.]|nr:serine/threonine protein kinase [Catenulispora sp.]